MEIIVVVAIVGILVGMVHSGFKGVLQRQRCTAAVNRIVSLLKEAQAIAREKRTICYVALAADENGTFDLALDTDYDANTTTSTSYRQVKIRKQYEGVTAQLTAQTGGLRFDYRGIPKGTPATITITRQSSGDNATITISSMGEIVAAMPDSWKR